MPVITSETTMLGRQPRRWENTRGTGGRPCPGLRDLRDGGHLVGGRDRRGSAPGLR